MSADQAPIGRDAILAALRSALEPLDHVNAFWEGGSAAFDRLDAMSDLDLHVDVADDRVEEVFTAAEDALGALSEIELRWRLAEPTWHGNSQAFYRLHGTSPYLLIDFVVLRRSSDARHDEIERHGTPRVIFDKLGIVRAGKVDRDGLRARLTAELAELKARFELFQPFVEKELARGNAMAALSFYQTLTLAPTHRALRILHAPARHDFGMRYVDTDLPPELAQDLTDLAFLAGPEELARKAARARAVFRETMATLERDGVPL